MKNIFLTLAKMFDMIRNHFGLAADDISEKFFFLRGVGLKRLCRDVPPPEGGHMSLLRLAPLGGPIRKASENRTPKKVSFFFKSCQESYS